MLYCGTIRTALDQLKRELSSYAISCSHSATQLRPPERARARNTDLGSRLKQDIRELHIGLLNMMPDSALEITERQFMRLVGNSNQIAQFYVHVFSLPGLDRSPQSAAYIDRYYTNFEQVKQDGLDALVITGANVANPSLDQENFWQPLTEVIEWAREHVTSTLCSCLSHTP